MLLSSRSTHVIRALTWDGGDIVRLRASTAIGLQSPLGGNGCCLTNPVMTLNHSGNGHCRQLVDVCAPV